MFSFKKMFACLACTAVMLASGALLTACRGGANPPGPEVPSTVSMSVSVDAEKVYINLTDEGTESGTANIVGVKAYQYLASDTYKGVSTDVVSIQDATVFGTYSLGTNYTCEIDRYTEQGFDNLYNKYYIVYNNEVKKGPVYATQIEPEQTAAPALSNKSKKGVIGESLTYFKDLGASNTVLNLDISNFIYPNEIVGDDGSITPNSHPDNAISFESNGKTYFFNKGAVEAFERQTRDYYNAGAKISVVVVSHVNKDAKTFPQKMTYAPYSYNAQLMALNTSNVYGFEYYVALIEFLTSRHTESNFENGFIANYVISNEVDYALQYNRISNDQAPFDTYMEELSRLYRLTNLAAKKYHSGVTVSVPFTHSFADVGYVLPGHMTQAYKPKEMIEWLNTRSKAEGDYDWGIAPHAYGYHLAQHILFLLDTYDGDGQLGEIPGGKQYGMSGDFNTSLISFSNLEVLDQYLHQDELLFNGKVRSVYLTESGVSSLLDSEEERNVQAGILAAAYYKIEQLESVVQFDYYRVFDNDTEISQSLRSGLIDIDKEEKPVYNVYKYIDTQYSKIVSEPYLQYVSYFDPIEKNENGQQKLQSFENGGVTKYEDLFDIFGTGYDFKDIDWDEIAKVTAPTVYEYEDVDKTLANVKFEDKSFIYDKNDHQLVAENVPDGITVEYTNNVRKELGSQKVLATFKRGETVIGKREATLKISRLVPSKTEYNYGENIFVTATTDVSDIDNLAWVGLYKLDTEAETDFSIYYYYFNTHNDKYLRTFCLQDGRFLGDEAGQPKPTIAPGRYSLIYFTDNGYNQADSCEIRVCSELKASEFPDMSNVRFEEREIDFTEHASVTYTGNLPRGVTCVYENNTLDGQAGTVQAIAKFYYLNTLFDVRYTTLTVLPQVLDRLVLDHPTEENGYAKYYVGQAVNVTATAPSNAGIETWWVGIYLDSDDPNETTSIYWYYTTDGNHINGTTYNIKDQTHNSNRSEFSGLPAGQYKVILFDGESNVMFTEKLEVVEFNEIGTVQTDKQKYSENENILVTATKPQNALSDMTYWVGIYYKGDVFGFDKDGQGRFTRMEPIYYYELTLDTDGQSVNIKDQSKFTSEVYNQYSDKNFRDGLKALPNGLYTVALFHGASLLDVNFVVDVTYDIQIGENDTLPERGSLTIEITTINVGDAITFTATTNSQNAWIGIYKIDDNLSEKASIKYYDASSNALNQSFTCEDAKDLAPGQYRVILFHDYDYTIDDEITITIQAIGEAD